MTTNEDLKKSAEQLKMMRERNLREQSKQSLEEEIKKEQMAYDNRHMGTLERNFRNLPSQLRKDLKTLQTSASSPSSKKKISKIRRMLDI